MQSFKSRRICVFLALALLSAGLMVFWLPNSHPPAPKLAGSTGRGKAGIAKSFDEEVDIVDADSTGEQSDVNAVALSAAVKEMMRFAWRSYVDQCVDSQNCCNELAPVSRSCSPMTDKLVGHDQALSAVESLDTLALMGLWPEFSEAKELATSTNRSSLAGQPVSVFETCIRMLGGYLGAYSLTEDSTLLAEAIHVANRLSRAFNNPNILGRNYLNLPYLNGSTADKEEDTSPNQFRGLAETGSLYLEFAYLSHLTGDSRYIEWVSRNDEYLLRTPSVRGLYPNGMLSSGQQVRNRIFTVAAGADSFYEYLVKKCQFSRKPDPDCASSYTAALDGIMNYLTVRVSRRRQPCVVAVKYPCPKRRQSVDGLCTMEHLSCFLGGTYALAYLLNPHRADWLKFAEDVTHTCYLSYLHSPTGLGPEKFSFDPKTGKFVAQPGEDFYLLRPETIESIYYLHYVTGNKKYRHWGRKILLTLNRTARTPYGFSGLSNMLISPTFDDTQQSFFMAETLKYLYLLFQPKSALPLDQWLLNTEAHIFPSGTNRMRRRMHG